VLPCYGKMSDHLFTGQTGDRPVQTSEFGVEFCTGLDGDGEDLAEMSTSELESLLLMENEADSDRQLTGYVTVDSGGIGSSVGSTKMQFDSVRHVANKQPAKVPYISEGLSSSSDEGDAGDAMWSYCAHTTRRRLRRLRPVRRPRNRTTDERKKQQNKTAATRYREKKRAEELENELLCGALERRNKELNVRVREMTQEVAVLRQLVIDVFRSPSVGSC